MLVQNRSIGQGLTLIYSQDTTHRVQLTLKSINTKTNPDTCRRFSSANFSIKVPDRNPDLTGKLKSRDSSLVYKDSKTGSVVAFTVVGVWMSIVKIGVNADNWYIIRNELLERYSLEELITNLSRKKLN